MGPESPTSQERLWKEYGAVFRGFDDLTLARWMSQTLSQFDGRAWRTSHPLIATYRLAAQVSQERQIWLKRLATQPAAYAEAGCCRAPMLPVLTRDARQTGLLCQHCNETLVPFDELPLLVKQAVGDWVASYAPVHAVAHWDDRQRKECGNYESAFDAAADQAERLLAQAGTRLAPMLLEYYPAVIWEDQDECLDVRPEDVIRD